MNKLRSNEISQLFKAIRTLKTEEECYMFFEDACTVKEIQDIAQRFQAAIMLKDGKNYSEVSSLTGMSSATISRVNKCLEYGEGGYNLAIDRMKKENAND